MVVVPDEMHRHSFVCVYFVTFATSLPAAERPNVVFILADVKYRRFDVNAEKQRKSLVNPRIAVKCQIAGDPIELASIQAN